MDENIKAVAGYAIVVVLAALMFWMGFRIIEAMVPIVGQVISGLFSIVGWAITIAGVIVIAILTVAMPLIVGAVLLLSFFWIADFVVRQIQKVREDVGRLGQAISKQARDASIDAAFLGALALMAALVFYMGTADFLEPFFKVKEALPHSPDHSEGISSDHSVVIRVLAVAAAASSVSKIFFLIPARSMKVVGILAMLFVLGGTASILADVYFAKLGFMSAWNGIMNSTVLTIFVMATSILVLLVAIAYPFTLGGWRRMWHIESDSAAPLLELKLPTA